MNVCQSCVFTPPKSLFLLNIFFMLDENPIENLIFFITSFTILLCCSIKHQGRLIFCWHPSPLELMITLCNVWLASWMSLQIFPILSLSILPCNIRHNRILLCSSQYALYQTNELFVGARSMETYWIALGKFSFLMEAHSCLNDIHETSTKSN